MNVSFRPVALNNQFSKQNNVQNKNQTNCQKPSFGNVDYDLLKYIVKDPEHAMEGVLPERLRNAYNKKCLSYWQTFKDTIQHALENKSIVAKMDSSDLEDYTRYSRIINDEMKKL